MASSPENTLNDSGTLAMIAAIWLISAEASFTPVMLAISREPDQRFGLNINARTARNVVDDDGNGNRLRNRLEVAIKALLSRPVIIRRHRKNAGDMQGFEILRQGDDLGGAVSTRPGHHWDAALGFRNGNFHDA